MIDIKPVKMKSGSTMLEVKAPYTPQLPERLRNLGGKWNASTRAWYLPLDMKQEVGKVCMEIFGIDPLAETPVETVTLHVDASNQSYGSELWLFGRQILARTSRDYAVRPGEGVSILGGGFERSGGSRNHPMIGKAKYGTTIVIRNVPVEFARQYASENENARIEEKHENASQTV